MALWRTVPRYAHRDSLDAYKWSHVWYVEAADLPTASAWGVSIARRQLAGMDTNTWCYEVYTSDLVPNTSNYQIVAPNPDAVGAILPASDLYHSSICVRINLLVTGGRPSRKYHRVPLREDWVAAGLTLNPTIAAAIDAAYADIITDITALRDESGNQITGHVVDALTSRRLGREARQDVPAGPPT